MKARMKQLTALAIFAILFLGGNANAKENKAITASGLETTLETTLEMETWMTSEAIWNTSKTEVVSVETDSRLELEGWMINPGNWDETPQLVMEPETGLELEDWMVNENNWKI
jgi:hypothetical protein